MPDVVIYAGATGYSVVVPRQENGSATETSTEEPPNPILPVPKEMAWGLGSFLLLVLLMRVWLFPKLRKGMSARYAKIQADHRDAERIREEAAEDVARYQAAVAEANAEANRVLEAARHELDADRQAKIGAANSRIADRRAQAAADIEAARAAALAGTEGVVVSIAARAAGLVLNTSVPPDAVRPYVTEVMAAGTVAR